MLKASPDSQPKESPFWQLLAKAEDIQIHEVEQEAEKGASPAPSPSLRTFLVQFVLPAPAAKEDEGLAPTAADREELLRSASVLVDNADYVLARHIYSFLLKENGRDEEALRGLGLCGLHLGDYVSAKKFFQALHDAGRPDEASFFLGQTCLAAGEEAQAVAYFQSVTTPRALTPAQRFTYYKELGNCLTRRGDFTAAEAAYRSALEIDPRADAVYVNLGTLELQRSRGREAAAHFRRALDIDPGNARARCGLGLVALQAGEWVAAQAELEATLDIDARNLVALHHLLVLAHREKEYARVKPRLERFVAKDSRNADVRYSLAVIHLKLGEWAACETMLSAALAISPDHEKARKLRDDVAVARRRA